MNNKIISTTLVLLIISGCGGGSGTVITSDTVTTPVNTLTLTGIAAKGAAVGNGKIEAKCATSSATTTSGTDGTYTLTSTTAVLPCLLRIALPDGSYLHSVAETGASSANITPLTELIAANVIGVTPSTVFTSFSTTDAGGITSLKVTNAKTVLVAVATRAGVDLSGTDPLKDTFIATSGQVAGDTKDQKIDALMTYLSSAGSTIQDLSSQIASSGSATDALSKMTTLLSVSTPAIKKFIGAAGVGELVQFNVNTDTLKFTYQILESQYGLNNKISTGDLTANSDGSYTQSTNTNSALRISKDGLIFGTIKETFQSSPVNTLFFGTANPSSSSVGIVGIYNVISRSCKQDAPFTCYGDYGTLKFRSDGKWGYCSQDNLTTAGTIASCAGYIDWGDYSWDGNYWRLQSTPKSFKGDATSTAMVTVGTALFTERPDGNIITIDWKDPRRGGYAGMDNGYTVGITQQSATGSILNSTFDRIQDDGTRAIFYNDVSGNVLFPVNPPTLTNMGVPIVNDPFTGFRRNAYAQSISLQLPGTGVYFSYSIRNGHTAVGIKVN